MNVILCINYTMTNYTLINDSNNDGFCSFRRYNRYDLLKKQSSLVDIAIINTCFTIFQTILLQSNDNKFAPYGLIPIVYTLSYMVILIRQINYNINVLCEEYEDSDDEEEDEEEDIYHDMPPLIPLSGPVNESYYDMPELACSTELDKKFESIAESDDELPPLYRMSDRAVESPTKASTESRILSQLKQVVDETNARNLRRRLREVKREN